MFKDVVKSVAKNSSIMVGQLAVTFGTTFFLMMFVARYLGPVEYGRLFLASSIAAIFRVIVEYGGTYLVAKSVAREHEGTAQIVVDQLGFRILLGFLSLVAMMVFASLAGYSPEDQVIILIFGFGLLWKGPHTVLYASFQGHEKMQYPSIGTIAENLFNSLVGVAALLLGARALTIAIIGQLSGLLNVVVMAWFAKKIMATLPKVRWRQSLLQLKVGLPYFLFAVFSTIYYRIDSIMLSKMAPQPVVGWYGAAYRMFEIQHILPFVLSVAVYPTLSRLFKEGGNVLKQTTQKGLEMVIMAGIPLTVVVIVFADRLVELFYGFPEYIPTVILLQVLVAGLTLLYVDMAIGTTLLAVDKQRQMSIVSLCAIPTNIGLNLLLIPITQARYGNGGIGAAVATTITEFGIMIAALNLLPRYLLKGFRISVVLKSLTAGALTTGFAIFLREIPINWIIICVSSAAVYLSLLFLLRTFQQVEVDFLKKNMNFKTFRALALRFWGNFKP